jgi:hypothetical protein
MTRRTRTRFGVTATAIAAAAAMAMLGAAPASAVITPTRAPTTLGGAMGLPGSGSGDFLTIPTPGQQGQEPHGIADKAPGFPRGGSAGFTILTTGDVTFADDPNTEESTGLDLFGPNVRGDSDYDVSVLRLRVPVTAADNCLSFEFRFLSEEFPEFVNAGFNDAFIAELRNSNWSTDNGTITAPNNFAFDAANNPITIDAVGETAVAPYRAVATTYDSATRIARASAPLTGVDQAAGSVDLFLSIFDQGDGIYDSAAFLDNLVVDSRANCTPGAQVLDSTDPDTAAEKPKIKSAPSSLRSADASKKKKKKKAKVTIPFSSNEPGSTFYCRVGPVATIQEVPYQECVSPFKAKLKKGTYQFDVVAIDGAGNPDPEPVSLTFKAKPKKKKKK